MSVFALPGAKPHYPPDLCLEPVHLDVAVDLDLAARSAAVAVTARLRARARARSVRLHAVGFVDLAVLGEGVERFAYDGEVLEVVFGAAAERGEERVVRAEYRVVRPLSGLHFHGPDAAYPDRPALAVTDHETERARYWLLTVDHPSVRTTLEWRITSDAAHEIVANGRRIAESVARGRRTAVWREDHPCPAYLACFAVGEFVRIDDGEVRGIPVATFVPRGVAAADVVRTFGRTKSNLEWIERRLGARFPFDKYFQVAAPMLTGAMENISLTTWDEAYVLDEARYAETGLLVEQINLHELAHSWFGDSVVIRDYEHAWLKESWATYLESCFLEENFGPEEGEYGRYLDGVAYFEETEQHYVRPIATKTYNSSWDLFDQHLYPGGARRLHLLRRTLGDDVFWPAVSDYLARFGGKLADTDAFRLVLEEHSGRSLGRFFDQWFLGKGFPKLKVKFTYEAEKKLGTFVVEQKQVDEKKGIGLFHLPLVLAAAHGDRLERFPVEIDGARHVFQVPLERDPTHVRVDPDGVLPAQVELDAGDRRARAQLVEARDVFGRIEAGALLAKSSLRPNLDALAEAFVKEPFYGVRVEWAKALGRAGSEDARDALVAVLGAEADPRVRRAIYTALGGFRSPAVAKALCRALEVERFPNARAAAFRALGRQRRDEDLPRLFAGASEPGPRGIARSGALEGLAETRRVEVLEVLERRGEYGADAEEVRAAAVTALARLGSLLERPFRQRAEDALVERMSDAAERVRWAAARGLVTLRAVGRAKLIEAAKAGFAHQHATKVDRLLRQLRQQDPDHTETQKLRREVEELRETVQKLERRLADLEAKPKGRPS